LPFHKYQFSSQKFWCRDRMSVSSEPYISGESVYGSFSTKINFISMAVSLASYIRRLTIAIIKIDIIFCWEGALSINKIYSQHIVAFFSHTSLCFPYWWVLKKNIYLQKGVNGDTKNNRTPMTTMIGYRKWWNTNSGFWSFFSSVSYYFLISLSVFFFSCFHS